MSPAKRKRLQLLAEIAEIKATRAKAHAADELQKVQQNKADLDRVNARKAAISPALQDPATALQAARWMTGCDARVQAMSRDMAMARAGLEDARDRARYEEGRRQVLARLSGQAS